MFLPPFSCFHGESFFRCFLLFSLFSLPSLAFYHLQVEIFHLKLKFIKMVAKPNFTIKPSISFYFWIVSNFKQIIKVKSVRAKCNFLPNRKTFLFLIRFLMVYNYAMVYKLPLSWTLSAVWYFSWTWTLSAVWYFCVLMLSVVWWSALYESIPDKICY